MLTIEQKKQIKLYKYLGAMLIEKGQWFLKKSFNVKFARIITGNELKNFLNGLGVENAYCSDNKYYIVDWKVMRSIIKYDWTDRKKYLVDRRDCDDFANAFKSNLSVIYGINSIGLARNVKVHIISENRDVWHRCNLILATEDNALKAFVFEAQSDGYQQLTKGVPIQIGGWQYQLGFIDF